MATYDIRLNPNTGGIYCFFEYKGLEFVADLCDIPYSIDYTNECMIFAAQDGKVISWDELYCKRNIPITNNSLIDCIEEFKRSLD